ncbi:alpha-amylase family glycosyl hydrolase [Paenibacillus timonensis]|uniref:Alpha-amylase n=1 Tax=Paenibacillus timonensis TaxID=225915 RepID=A0ABW3SCG0_9BACL|nr:alpha-amylase family glycosyl hydrolase [Paenibacillus timonensis]MCH1640281.1 alpha-amylase family glycosyl hydrolase [Paenibacillus timonensis]
MQTHNLPQRTPLRRIGSAVLILLLLAGCTGSPGGSDTTPEPQNNAAGTTANSSPNNGGEKAATADAVDPQPSTVFYEVFVRSFADSNGDGIGDFKGLTGKLDYLNDGNPNTDTDLGIGGIWLMPINPSPSYHGYDVTDYRNINPDYGTLDDFRTFLDEAHQRGIKVIMDLVVNHTSKEHPWFTQSATDKNSPYRDWYVWAEDSGRATSGTSAAGSGNPWHSLRGDHYLGIFWDGMPDLNFDNPEVRKEMTETGQFWLEQGVDGFRLDAAKHIYEDLQTDKSQGTTDKNVAWWQEFRSGLNEANPDAYLVGEVWDPSAALIASYLDGALDSGFNFSLAETILSSVKNEKDANIPFTLERSYKLYGEKSGGKFVDATFLANHDQNRVMTQLEGDLPHAKMAASLLLTLPGNPFIYYGEEIGMFGAKPDELIREPMRWTQDDSEGQTTWETAENNAGKQGLSVSEQTGAPDSLLSHYRKLIRMRNAIPALKDGAIQEYATDQPGVTAYVRLTEDQAVLVAHNLTGSPLTVTLHPDRAGGKSFAKILAETGEGASLIGNTLTLPAYSTAILE